MRKVVVLATAGVASMAVTVRAFQPVLQQPSGSGTMKFSESARTTVSTSLRAGWRPAPRTADSERAPRRSSTRMAASYDVLIGPALTVRTQSFWRAVMAAWTRSCGALLGLLLSFTLVSVVSLPRGALASVAPAVPQETTRLSSAEWDGRAAASLRGRHHLIPTSDLVAFGGKKAAAEAGSSKGVIFSMRTAAEKYRLSILVSASYVAIWAFFYLTHDGGEVSE